MRNRKTKRTIGLIVLALLFVISIGSAYAQGGTSANPSLTSMILDWKFVVMLGIVFFKLITPPENERWDPRIVLLSLGIIGVLLEVNLQGINNPISTFFGAMTSFNLVNILKYGTSITLLAAGIITLFTGKGKGKGIFSGLGGIFGSPDKKVEGLNETIKKQRDEINQLKSGGKTKIEATRDLIGRVKHIFKDPNGLFADYKLALSNRDETTARQIAGEIVREIHKLRPTEGVAFAEEFAARLASKRGVGWRR